MAESTEVTTEVGQFFAGVTVYTCIPVLTCWSTFLLYLQPKFKDESSGMRCRFYENHFPEPEEVVMVNVTQIGEMGAYVTLLEYDDIEVS